MICHRVFPAQVKSAGFSAFYFLVCFVFVFCVVAVFFWASVAGGAVFYFALAAWQVWGWAEVLRVKSLGAHNWFLC
jgi:hypothetical protein